MPAPNQHLITHLNRVEILFLILISIALVVLSWFGFKDTRWMITYIATLGITAPILYKSHLEASEFIHRKPWRQWFAINFPAISISLIYLAGLFFQSQLEIQIGGEPYTGFSSPISPWLPSQVSINSSLNSQTGYVGVYLIASLLLFIPRTKLFFERLMQVLFINNFLLCVAFLIGSLIKSIEFLKDLPVTVSPVLTSSDAWSGFILVWIVSLWGHFISHFRYRRMERSFINERRWVLAATGIAILTLTKNMNAWLAMWLFAVIAFALIHYARLIQRRSRHRSRRKKRIWIAMYSLSIVSIISSLWAATQVSILITENMRFSDEPREQTSIQSSSIEAALRMIKERPITGWGSDSFNHMGSFFTEPTEEPLMIPSSDFLFNMVQFGFLGCLLLAWIPTAQIFKYLKTRKRNNVSDYAVLATGIGVAFGIAAVPTIHGAYIYLWLVILFTGIRWADISFAERLQEKRYQQNVRVFRES